MQPQSTLLTTFPKSMRAPNAMHRALRLGRAIVAACCCFIVLVGCGDDGKELSIEQVRTMHGRGNWEPTIEPLRARIDAGDRDSETLLLYGIALTRSGFHSQALWPLRDAAQDPEHFIEAMMQLASGAYVTGNHDLAIERLGEVIDQEPENINALTMRGMSRLHSRRDYEGALEDIERILDLEPDRTQMKASRIVALLGLKKVEEAREAIEEFAEEEIVPEGEESETPVPIRALACVGRAKFAQEDKNKEDAAQFYLDCVEAFPTQAIAIHEAMEYFRDEDDYEKFDEILKKAYEAAPEDRTFRIALARREQTLGNLDAAREVLEAGMSAGYPGAAIDLAGFLSDIDDKEGALENYRKARDLGASGPTFLLTFGEALIAAGEYDEALALTQDPGPKSHKLFIRGRVALKRGNFEEALEHFTEGVLQWPDNAVARYYTALAAEQVGDIDRAVEEYRNAMRIDADAADTRVRLARLHLAEINPRAALYILRYQTNNIEDLRQTTESILLELEGVGWSGKGEVDNLPPELVTRISYPGVWGQAIASLSRGVRKRAGIDAAINTIVSADRLDLRAPNAAQALDYLIELLGEKGEHEKAIEFARAGANANPKRPVMAAILGKALLSAGKLEEADVALAKALEIDSTSPAALLVRGQVAVKQGQAERAVEFFELVPKDRIEGEFVRAHAQALADAGKGEAAEALLKQGLIDEPYEGETALALAKLKLSRGLDASDPAVEPILRRAVRFGQAGEALALLGEAAPADASPEEAVPAIVESEASAQPAAAPTP